MHGDLAVREADAHTKSHGNRPGRLRARIRVAGDAIEIGRLATSRKGAVPGDLSSRCVLIAAASAMFPTRGSRVTGVGLNPTRSGFLSLLQEMGAKISIAQPVASGESR
jgi:3-phosphoshikimate 1-carboxyvinyltransferase